MSYWNVEWCDHVWASRYSWRKKKWLVLKLKFNFFSFVSILYLCCSNFMLYRFQKWFSSLRGVFIDLKWLNIYNANDEQKIPIPRKRVQYTMNCTCTPHQFTLLHFTSLRFDFGNSLWLKSGNFCCTPKICNNFIMWIRYLVEMHFPHNFNETIVFHTAGIMSGKFNLTLVLRIFELLW